jgi:hypothetical protein
MLETELSPKLVPSKPRAIRANSSTASPVILVDRELNESPVSITKRKTTAHTYAMTIFMNLSLAA